MTDTQPMVSVIIPTYNRAALIGRSIASVLGQTYENIEVVIVDDGSTDETAQVVNSIADGRIRYVCQENRGACSARNHGVAISKGDFIGFHDSDDIWRPEKLARQMAEMLGSGADVCACRMQIHDPEQKTDLSITPLPNVKKITFSELLGGNCIGMPTILGRAEIIASQKFDEDLPRLQDWDYVLRLLKTQNIVLVDEVLVDSFVQKDSITRNNISLVRALERIGSKFSVDYASNLSAYADYLAFCGSAYESIHEYRQAFYSFSKSLTVKPFPKAFFRVGRCCVHWMANKYQRPLLSNLDEEDHPA